MRSAVLPAPSKLSAARERPETRLRLTRRLLFCLVMLLADAAVVVALSERMVPELVTGSEESRLRGSASAPPLP